MIFRPTAVVLTVIGLLACLAPTWAEDTAPGMVVVESGKAPGETVVVEPCGEPVPAGNVFTDNCVTRFFHSVCRDAKRNNCWPDPFLCPDRQAVRMPFVTMVAKGWQRQNTMGDQDFVPETGQLTFAGQSKVRHILLEGLPGHQTIYVHRSLMPNETAARVDAVQQLAARTVRQGELPDIRETDLPSPGWSAEQIDDVGRKYRSTTPDPRLPKEETAPSATQ